VAITVEVDRFNRNYGMQQALLYVAYYYRPTPTELTLVPDPFKRPQQWPQAFVEQMNDVRAARGSDWLAWGLPLSAMLISTLGVIVRTRLG
jgi:hypothetical protein